MSESKRRSDVVSRVLQVTQASWLQTPALPLQAHQGHGVSSRQISRHRTAAKPTALDRRSPWAWPVAVRMPHLPQA